MAQILFCPASSVKVPASLSRRKYSLEPKEKGIAGHVLSVLQVIVVPVMKNEICVKVIKQCACLEICRVSTTFNCALVKVQAVLHEPQLIRLKCLFPRHFLMAHSYHYAMFTSELLLLKY